VAKAAGLRALRAGSVHQDVARHVPTTTATARGCNSPGSSMRLTETPADRN